MPSSKQRENINSIKSLIDEKYKFIENLFRDIVSLHLMLFIENLDTWKLDFKSNDIYQNQFYHGLIDKSKIYHCFYQLKMAYFWSQKHQQTSK